MTNLTKEESLLLKELVKKELKDLEEYEHDFESYTVNSPVLSTIFRMESDLGFIASVEKYKEFLEKIIKKL